MQKSLLLNNQYCSNISRSLCIDVWRHHSSWQADLYLGLRGLYYNLKLWFCLWWVKGCVCAAQCWHFQCYFQQSLMNSKQKSLLKTSGHLFSKHPHLWKTWLNVCLPADLVKPFKHHYCVLNLGNSMSHTTPWLLLTHPDMLQGILENKLKNTWVGWGRSVKKSEISVCEFCGKPHCKNGSHSYLATEKTPRLKVAPSVYLPDHSVIMLGRGVRPESQPHKKSLAQKSTRSKRWSIPVFFKVGVLTPWGIARGH